ncbi:peptidase M48 [Polynucleobacter wuianus]|uniref:Peptidase M48 n=1 Tax=Polynucleobacter wuianus TaxID=1743168 RepID=A0A191UEV1_9BURK|nr:MULTISPECIES: M48 family metallopeptidase [Polynucleobacter]ANI99549.1 peptidase M48 [Polynucleobacter wuianus]MBU3551824.1 M48 family metallopeptidase [Polynucleobacter sp. MWH-Post4-6-1]MBU3610793.1 M48 family metallopeptidase [Polynucleobacter wuianus]
MQLKVVWFKLFLISLLSTLLLACANTTRSGAVGVNRSQFLVVSASEVDRLSAISYNEQNQKAKEKNILVTSGPEYSRLKTISNRLISQTGVFRDDTHQWNWQLVLIDAPILNATCAPGGKITFYTGLIEQLNLSDDEIAAIMGHEIAHALREHGRERLSQAMAQSAVVNIAIAAAGSYGSAISAANQASQYILVLPNSRQNESEADAIGIELAARAGYNPQAAISVWQKMNKATQGKGTLEFLSTHPSGDTRIEQLSELMPVVQPLYLAAPKAKAK